MRKLLCIILIIAAALTGCISIVVPADVEETENIAAPTDIEEIEEPPITERLIEPMSPQTPLSPAQIYEYNADAVFTIYTSNNGRNFGSNGSGFFICETGIAVTNHHVIANWLYAYILTHCGNRFDISGYYYYYIGADLAVIQVDGSGFTYLQKGDSDAMRVGENVYAIGSPLGYHNTFSTGIISRFDDVAEFDIYRVYGMIQFTAPISGGSSGGALLNGAGQVIGITTAAYGGSVAQAINFAVPIARLEFDRVGEYSSLPIGEVIIVEASEIIGTWTWSGGTYTFDANGRGSRIWDGEYAEFQWRIGGNVLDLNIRRGGQEWWTVSVINENEITIGGAWFTRSERPDGLVGSWTWDGGTYSFYVDGSGSRVWDSIPATFNWDVANDMLSLAIHGGEPEHWVLRFTANNNEVNIGGALFVRE